MGHPYQYVFASYGTTNATLLVSVPLEVVTVTEPVVAPAGTFAVISVFETTLNVVATPLNSTAVVPVRLFPRMTTLIPLYR